MNIEILDTTLRDGAQGEGISFSVQDKLAIVRALDELGIPWIEAGNPGSNPKDSEFFSQAARLKLDQARLCAFGATRRPNVKCTDDPQLRSLLEAGTVGISIFGKSWNLHVKEVLRVSEEENLAMIAETIEYLKAEGRIVLFDAEHFFDGWKANPGYALSTLQTALKAGADRIVLCDTNGASFPGEIRAGVAAAIAVLGGSAGPHGRSEGGAQEQHASRRACFVGTSNAAPPPENGSFLNGGSAGPQGRSEGGPDSNSNSSPECARKEAPFLGIHAHNDTGLAIAASIAAAEAGCAHIQGTLAGFGERCGNTCLAALIPSLELKLDCVCLPKGKLERISEITRLVAEVSNVPLPASMPYVGSSAFSHKGGMHSDGVLKLKRSFEHIDPAQVGNDRHLLMSEIGGRSAIAERIRKIDPDVTRDHPAVAAVVEKLKTMEAAGWAFEGADASFELLVLRELGRHKPFFTILAYRVMSEHPTGQSLACSHAWVKILADSQDEIAAAEGNGPVHALDGALRRALRRFYPSLEDVRLTDYKVRVIDGGSATAAKVRVLIESSDGPHTWTTVGVSDDIIDASRAALVDSIEYKLTNHL